MHSWTNQLTLLFSDPAPDGQARYGQDVRKRFASILDGDPIGPELFHRLPNGQNNKTLSPVRFRSGKRSYSVVGIGEKGVEIIGRLTAKAPFLTARPVPIKLLTGRISVTEAERPYFYEISSFLPANKARHSRYLLNDGPDIPSWLAERIDIGLRKQAEYLHLDLPKTDIKVVEYSRLLAAKIKPEVHVCPPRVRVVFRTWVRLSGDWAVGAFLAHGHGIIRPYRGSCAPRMAA